MLSKNKYNCEEQYIDVVGPYSNEYKLDEVQKDYYMRVIYNYEKRNFIEYFISNEFVTYLIGGITVDIMNNVMLYQIKSLINKYNLRTDQLVQIINCFG